MKENIFYDINKLLSYNALLSFVVGERGVGKSYGAKKFVAKRFINKHKIKSYGNGKIHNLYSQNSVNGYVVMGVQ